MISVIIINGYPESGKDTFVDMCGRYMPVWCLHTSTPVKEALEHLGWDGKKTHEVRKVLAELKEFTDQQFGTSNRYIAERIKSIQYNHEDGIIFIHSREPKNIDYFKKTFDAETLFVIRDNPNRVISNDSDNYVENYTYDIYVDNKGTLEELREKAKNFVLLGDV